MNNDAAKEFLQELEAKFEITLTERQEDLAFRCHYLGFDDESMETILLSDSLEPANMEYLMVCFLDGMEPEYINREIIPEKSVEEIRKKRMDYLLERYHKKNPEYMRLMAEFEQLKRLSVVAEEQSEQLSKRYNNMQSEFANIQNAKQELVRQVEQLTKEKKRLQIELKEKEKPVRQIEHIEHVEKTVTYKKPQSVKEKLAFLKNGDLEEIITTTKVDASGDGDIIEILCDPKFSIEQVSELQQAALDGIDIEQIRKIAKPQLAVDVIRQMRKFMCKKAGLEFEESELVKNMKMQECDHNEGQSDEPGESLEEEITVPINVYDDDEPDYDDE